MADNAEDFVIRLTEIVSGPAGTAENAIAELESRIKSQGAAIGQYEQQLAAAAAKLRALGEGDARGAVNVAAFRKQQEVVASLQQKVDDATASYERLEAARPLAGQAAEWQKARGAISSAADALAELEAKMDLAAAAGATADVNQLTGAINRQRQAVLDAQQAYIKMGGSAKDAMAAGGGAGRSLGVSASQAAGGTNELVNALGSLEGPVGDTVSRGEQLSDVFKAMGGSASVGAVGFIALAVAVPLVTIALIAATVVATKWAITMADAARNQALSLESLAANHKALANIADIMPRVQSATGLANDEINGLAERLAKAKIPAKNMEAALTAMATATAGGASSEFLTKLEAGLKKTGKVPAELAEQMAKFEAIAKKKMLSLDSQGEQLQRNITGLFDGIKIDGFLEALSKIVRLFDSSTASGQALKFILETLFQPLIDAATNAIPAIIRGFLKLQIAVLKAYIAVQKLKEALPDTSGGQGGTGGMRANIDTFNAMAAAANAAHGPIDATGQAYGRMKAAMQGGAAELKATSLAGAGANMVTTLANSITAGQSSVVSAMTATVQAAVAAAEKAAEISSPSKVMQRLGRFLPQGMAIGIDDEAAVVEKSAESMATGAVKGAAGATAGGSPGGSGKQFSFYNCVFGGDLDESSLRGMLNDIFHQAALEPEPEG